MNRFQRSAQRIIDGNFGNLQKSLSIIKYGQFDYELQASTEEIVADTKALKRKLTKREYESSNVQSGDFALIFTNPQQIDLDTFSGVYDGVPVSFVEVISFAGDAAQGVVARVK